jgi:hypothetical protein
MTDREKSMDTHQGFGIEFYNEAPLLEELELAAIADSRLRESKEIKEECKWEKRPARG